MILSFYIVILQYTYTTWNHDQKIFSKRPGNFGESHGTSARIAIIQYLIKVNSCICGHCNELPLSQPQFHNI
jgi:hypothetical protein